MSTVPGLWQSDMQGKQCNGSGCDCWLNFQLSLRMKVDEITIGCLLNLGLCIPLIVASNLYSSVRFGSFHET